MTTIPVERELLERAWRLLANSDTGRLIGAVLDAAPCDPKCAETCVRASMCATCSALLAEQPQVGAGHDAPSTTAIRRAARFLDGIDNGCNEVKTLRKLLDQPAARHDQGDEVRRLREALESARSHCVTWQGEPHEYSCSVHKAVIGVIDAALTHSPKGEEE